MKKLLALVLCVMMFVAVIPTAAFAAGDTTNYKAWPATPVSSTAITEAEKSIKNMYTAIATDELVFSTAKSLYDLSNGLATQMFDGIESVDKYNPATAGEKTAHDDLVANTRKYMNAIIGDSIASYIKGKVGTFESNTTNGGVDPAKYLNVFVAAVNDAVTSEKAQKGLQAFVYNLYALRTMSAVKKQAEDIQTAIKDWGSGKWGEFGSNFDASTFVYNATWDSNGMWSAGSNGGDPMTNPWAYTNSAYSGNSSANIQTTWSLITNGMSSTTTGTGN